MKNNNNNENEHVDNTNNMVTLSVGNFVKLAFDKEGVYEIIRIHFDEDSGLPVSYDIDDGDNFILYNKHIEELTKLWTSWIFYQNH